MTVTISSPKQQVRNFKGVEMMEMNIRREIKNREKKKMKGDYYT